MLTFWIRSAVFRLIRARVGFAIAAAALIFVALASGGKSRSEEFLNVAYGPREQHRLDLCLPAPSATPTAAVLLIHGGGWSGGDKSDMAWHCRYFAAHGVLAASAGYRLADGRPENGWPAQLIDVQLAVRWLRANSDGLNINPARICAYGHSAGGQLAVWLAVESRIFPDALARELAGISPKVSCAVDNFGLFQLTPDMPGYKLLFSRLFPRESEASLSNAATLSPVASVRAATSPIFISHGTRDRLAPLSQSLMLFHALNRCRVRSFLSVFEGGHEFWGASPDTKSKILAQELDFVLDQAWRDRAGRSTNERSSPL